MTVRSGGPGRGEAWNAEEGVEWLNREPRWYFSGIDLRWEIGER